MGHRPATYLRFGFNCYDSDSGRVNIDDVLMVLAAWGNCLWQIGVRAADQA